MNISIIIETQRRIKGISQEELAIRLHMSLSTYHKRLENPETFRLGEIVRGSKVLGIDICTMINGKIVFKD